jgi:excisionase family DNA binding protein
MSSGEEGAARVAEVAKILDQFERQIQRRWRPNAARLSLVQRATVLPDEYQAIIDDALRLTYAQYNRVVVGLDPSALTPLSLERLRNGPLGEDLARLAQVASGNLRVSRDEVLRAIDSVLQFLFWPVGAETYTVPRSFWEQPLGKMLSLAKLRSYEPTELISIGAAANVLKVTRPTIYRWIDEKVLDFVRDDMSGRTFVVRQDVVAMKADMEAAETSGSNLAAALRDATGLPSDTLADLLDVPAATYEKWLTGSRVSAEQVPRLTRALAMFRTLDVLREVRGADLQRFLETPGPAGRPLDLLKRGDADAVVGLALRQTALASPAQAVSAAARQTSALPGWLHPGHRLAWGTTKLVDTSHQDLLEQLSPAPLPENEVAAEDDEDDEPVVATYSFFVG